MTDRLDIYQTVTDTLVAALEAGTKPWQRSWATVGLPRRATGQEYRGINTLLLSLAAQARGYTNPHWITFKQAKDMGGCVRKGESSTLVVFYKPLTVQAGQGEIADENGERTIRMLKYYRVFNVEQVDGLPMHRFPVPTLSAGLTEDDRDAQAEEALRSCGATIREGGDRAYYDPASDHVQMPAFAAFASVGAYLATMAHELVHWSGGKARLDRLTSARFGSKDYAAEELVAEIGAAFLCARLGVEGEHIDNHAAYLASWLKCLREDKRAIFRAAAAAQVAADLVLANATLPDRPTVADPAAPAAVAPPVAPVAQFALAL